MARSALPWLSALAVASLASAGCTVTTDNGNDGGGGNTSDDGGATPEASSNDAAVQSPDASVVAMPDAGGGTTPDAGNGTAPDAGGTTPDAAGQADAAPDGSSASPDGSMGGTTGDGGMTWEGGITPPSCISALYGEYVQRVDGVVLNEQSNAEQPVLDSSTGTALTGVVSVQEGNYHGCATLSGGGVECWQKLANQGNSYGQLGNGNTMATGVVWRATPVLTAASTPLTNVTAMANGWSNAACAVTSDGKLWCWGDLAWLVNNGTALSAPYAQAITTDGMSALTGVIQATTGFDQACALVKGSPNTVWCWGYNGYGTLGQGDTKDRQYPTQVLGLGNPTKLVIASNGNSAGTVCALDGGSVRCWGFNGYGEAGVNSTTNPILSPTLVVTQSGATLSGVTDLQAGEDLSTVLRNDNTMWWWGSGAKSYAANYGVTNIDAIGWPGNTSGPRYLTSDGVYHNAMTAISVKCSAL